MKKGMEIGKMQAFRSTLLQICMTNNCIDAHNLPEMTS